MKKAFTLIELIFVIVLLSIISMFGADLYVKIYNSYTNNRATSDLEGETERTLNIITSLLRDRVKQTVIGRATDNGEHPDGDFVYLDQVQEEHDVLEWIGKSTETQYIGSANKGVLGWSGFDIKMAVPSGDFVIQSPGSSLENAESILNSLNAGTKSFGIIFNDGEVDANSFGYNKTNNHTNIGTVKITSDDTMQIIGLTSRNKNRYFLVHTAYAIVPVLDNNAADVNVRGIKSNTYNLLLYYDFQPWEGEKYNNKDGKSVILAKNVTMFRFTYDNNSVAVKLCMRDNNRNFDAKKLDFIVCKSQVVE
ncbi:type II secretion system protein [Campylobacter hominis]